ncbi:DNA/RNA non-specific endonuclease [Neiella sp. HB171785]|uniref:DNA/RNA non-specific endonuclease n=1 Tax=Neiella litorisoli TaxID=2771431 RepID=A0A8J6QU40_9GAMM|nr:DNA/RNA non-specific endonuclease [Neiella litorisoli]MBD1389422.1 DNA/RNA non-specific endonuclease [Neiella litorisoli]
MNCFQLIVLAGAAFAACAVARPSDDIIYLDFGSFEVGYNCEHRGAEFVHFRAEPDAGDEPRYRPFHHEIRLPERCRQLSTKSYKRPASAAPKYDRGHLAEQNIVDHNKELMRERNTMANIVPQNSLLNRRGLWRHLEKITECYREEGSITVYSGVIWGTDTSNDHFIESHGVTTPDFLWKVLVRKGGQTQAWLMPNDDRPVARHADLYRVSVLDIEKKSGWIFPLSPNQKLQSQASSWSIPKGCRLN